MGSADDRAHARQDPVELEIEQLRRQVERLQLQLDEQHRQQRIVRTYSDISNDDSRVYVNTGWPTAKKFEFFVEFLFGDRNDWDLVWANAVRYDWYMRLRAKKRDATTAATTTTTIATSTTSIAATTTSSLTSTSTTSKTARRRNAILDFPSNTETFVSYRKQQ